MSLYNALFGRNPLSDQLLVLLGLTRVEVGRFRDVHIKIDAETKEPRIAVFTRNGGGNRECSKAYEDGGLGSGPSTTDCGDPGCYGCIITHRLPKHPLYVSDADDEFDCTYATVLFRVPEAARSMVALLVTPPTEEPMARFQTLITKLQSGNQDDPDVKRALEVGQSIFGAIEKEMKRKEGG